MIRSVTPPKAWPDGLFLYLHRFSTANQYAFAAFGDDISCPAFFTGVLFPDLISHFQNSFKPENDPLSPGDKNTVIKSCYRIFIHLYTDQAEMSIKISLKLRCLHSRLTCAKLRSSFTSTRLTGGDD
jgi:hypothetical protein